MSDNGGTTRSDAGTRSDVAVRVVLLACWTYLFSTLWLLVIAVAPTAIGWTPSIVATGSMAPHIAPGDIVVSDGAGSAAAKQGTVIRYWSPHHDSHVIHRVVEMTENGDIITKGDANRRKDTIPIAAADVEGRGRLLVPFIGRPMLWIQNGMWAQVGVWLTVTVIALLAACSSGAPARDPRDDADTTSTAGDRPTPDTDATTLGTSPDPEGASSTGETPETPETMLSGAR